MRWSSTIGLQTGSDVVAARAVEFAESVGCASARVQAVDVTGPGGLEAAARHARYRALDDARRGHPVLLGHTLDDQAETVLLGLGRGSGLRSIRGMRAVRRPMGPAAAGGAPRHHPAGVRGTRLPPVRGPAQRRSAVHPRAAAERGRCRCSRTFSVAEWPRHSRAPPRSCARTATRSTRPRRACSRTRSGSRTPRPGRHSIPRRSRRRHRRFGVVRCGRG